MCGQDIETCGVTCGLLCFLGSSCGLPGKSHVLWEQNSEETVGNRFEDAHDTATIYEASSWPHPRS